MWLNPKINIKAFELVQGLTRDKIHPKYMGVNSKGNVGGGLIQKVGV